MSQNDEHYRDRWLNCFLATYATIGVLSGVFASFAAIIATEGNRVLISSVFALSAIQVFLILWMLHRLRRAYDLLGFAPEFQKEDREKKYYADAKAYASVGKTIRRICEKAVHIILILQLVLLWFAWKE